MSETRYVCPECGNVLVAYVPPTKSAQGKPEVWCFRVLAHRRGRDVRMKRKATAQRS